MGVLSYEAVIWRIGLDHDLFLCEEQRANSPRGLLQTQTVCMCDYISVSVCARACVCARVRLMTVILNKSLHRDLEKTHFAHFCEELFCDASSGLYFMP